jgi:hypothetical protein
MKEATGVWLIIWFYLVLPNAAKLVHCGFNGPGQPGRFARLGWMPPTSPSIGFSGIISFMPTTIHLVANIVD